ncbi:hypothetical protein RF11_07717 [Thelohanellus kitauei]|uniref:Uncharacterized protein n=1 Tax=Thelohanellus kitauei TaxID=669202 RepID=A0A0C2IP83_THEKT|nr:hypothetical protein RF11_07717 [Thelohanellus kitauei]
MVDFCHSLSWTTRNEQYSKKMIRSKQIFFCSQLEVFKPAPVHFCTDFTSTASETVSTYGRVVLQRGSLLQAVRVVQDSHLLNTHPYPQPTRATIPTRNSFAGMIETINHYNTSYNRWLCKIDKYININQFFIGGLNYPSSFYNRKSINYAKDKFIGVKIGSHTFLNYFTSTAIATLSICHCCIMARYAFVGTDKGIARLSFAKQSPPRTCYLELR